MNKKLKGKVALITGSSRGIGRQIALGLAELGADIIVHGSKPDSPNKTLELLKPFDVQAYSIVGDLNKTDEINKIIEDVNRLGIAVDVLYNNAAIINKETPIFKFSMETWQNIFSVNLFAMVQLCNAFVPQMVDRGFGRVINLSSGIENKPEFAPYSVSKAAVDKFSRDLAFELKDTNVLVNYLDPGWIKTDMGGEEAFFDVETIIPGALVPALLDNDGPTGKFYLAQDYKYLK